MDSSRKKIVIPGQLTSAEPDKIVVVTDEVYDNGQGKKQNSINTELYNNASEFRTRATQLANIEASLTASINNLQGAINSGELEEVTYADIIKVFTNLRTFTQIVATIAEQLDGRVEEAGTYESDYDNLSDVDSGDNQNDENSGEETQNENSDALIEYTRGLSFKVLTETEMQEMIDDNQTKLDTIYFTIENENE